MLPSIWTGNALFFFSAGFIHLVFKKNKAKLSSQQKKLKVKEKVEQEMLWTKKRKKDKCSLNKFCHMQKLRHL